jgi:hypothetical protein
VATGDWVYAGFDLVIWAFAALHAVLAVRVSWAPVVVKKIRPARVAVEEEA